MKRLSKRELKRMQGRMLQGMGLDMDEMGKADQVVFHFGQRRLVVKEPSVVSMTVEKERIFQVLGGTISEEEAEAPELMEEVKVSEDDAAIVAQQAGVSLDEATQALVETGGDLAKAVLLLKSRRE